MYRITSRYISKLKLAYIKYTIWIFLPDEDEIRMEYHVVDNTINIIITETSDFAEIEVDPLLEFSKNDFNKYYKKEWKSNSLNTILT